MWTRSKTTALAVFALIVSSIAVAHTDGIYNPTANSVGDTQGIDSNAATGGAPAYVGPGDINGAAAGWWGLRAYSTAYAAGLGNIADIVDTATNTFSCTVKSKSNGDADLTSLSCTGGTLSVTTFCTVTHPAGCSIAKLYDQSGGTRDMVSTANVTQFPLFTFNAVGTKPGMASSPTIIMCTAAATGPAQPLTISGSYKRTSGVALSTEFGNGGLQLGFDAANITFLYATGAVVDSISATDNAFHAIQTLFNTAASTISSDGTTSGSLNPGTADLSASSSWCLGASIGQSNPFTGIILETGVWAGNKSANTVSMNSNQHTYWGF